MSTILNKEESVQFLSKLGVPEGLIQVTAHGGGTLHETLFRLRPPHTIYASQDTIPYKQLAVLFEKGRHAIAYDLIMRRYIRFDLAFPDTVISCYKNVQNVLAEELTRLVAGGLPKTIFEKVSNLLGFKYTELLWVHYINFELIYLSDYKNWLDDLIMKIDMHLKEK
ncbi:MULTISPECIES: hypothetical protein [Olivibacter]|jgi:hypothetical protein|uniref:Uncharacterized protein n=2 Tax=Olivibacter TaxID=376469 RepID=A0ABV6HKQ2_9SPHI|nr:MULTISPECIES: hypothetical protein [Olivibacter]MCL4637421.1 hypothetical protein [Olivibacter sp. UJ_SKK_5.1]MDM8175515.1 hypothetical protein [Olivibacter sp. 47]MDX3914124.1 hypothetical protein [Pseudosphingobacterium sp.]QEL02267.1 hypothetical protein FKG96_16095 [Olivibacter sp. LS-1]